MPAPLTFSPITAPQPPRDPQVAVPTARRSNPITNYMTPLPHGTARRSKPPSPLGDDVFSIPKRTTPAPPKRKSEEVNFDPLERTSKKRELGQAGSSATTHKDARGVSSRKAPTPNGTVKNGIRWVDLKTTPTPQKHSKTPILVRHHEQTNAPESSNGMAQFKTPIVEHQLSGDAFDALASFSRTNALAQPPKNISLTYTIVADANSDNRQHVAQVVKVLRAKTKLQFSSQVDFVNVAISNGTLEKPGLVQNKYHCQCPLGRGASLQSPNPMSNNCNGWVYVRSMNVTSYPVGIRGQRVEIAVEHS